MGGSDRNHPKEKEMQEGKVVMQSSREQQGEIRSPS